MPAHRRGRRVVARRSGTCVFGRRWSLLVLAVILSSPGLALAQVHDSNEAEEAARFHWGPLALTPTFTIPTMGVDSNVFNEQEDPKSDFTVSLEPAADYWLRLGRARLSARSVINYEYFHEYETQRSFNGSQNAKMEFQLDRYAPYVEGGYTVSRLRSSLEVDARARQTRTRVGLGVAMHVSERTRFDLSSFTGKIEYDPDEFSGVYLRESFNRDSTSVRAQLSYGLTPLTTFVVRGTAVQDRFEFSTFRDSDSLRILPGFNLKPLALIRGHAFVGYARIESLDPAVADYSGVIADVGVGYELGTTPLDFRVRRDVVYSAESGQPFFVQTGLGLTATRRLTTRWDAKGRYDHDWLRYPSDERGTDTARTYGCGIGFYLRPDVRLGFDLDYSDRVSRVSNRSHDRLL